MTDPYQLGRAIGDLVPDPPAAQDRASSVLRLARRRRRRGTIAGTTVAVVAVAGIALGATALGSSSGRPDAAAPTRPSSPATTPAPAVECPADAVPDGSLVPVEDTPLPDGPVVARLCSQGGGPGSPSDVLVTDVDRIVHTISTLPPYRERPCSRGYSINGGGGFWIVLGYPDGTSRSITGGTGDCDGLRGAGPRRDDATEVWDLYLELVKRQRAATEPPGSAIACPADDLSSSPLGNVLKSEHAVLRWRRINTESSASWSCAPIPDADLPTILADLADPRLEFEPVEEECLATPLDLNVVGVNAWGDAGSAYGVCGGLDLQGGGSTHRLGSEAQAVVDRIVAAGPDSELPTISRYLDPDEVVSLFADLVNDGSLDDARRLTTDPSLIDVDGHLDVATDAVTATDPTGGRERVVVGSLYRILPTTLRHPFIDYREATIQMSRRPGAVWQIDSIDVGEVVPTGR